MLVQRGAYTPLFNSQIMKNNNNEKSQYLLPKEKVGLSALDAPTSPTGLLNLLVYIPFAITGQSETIEIGDRNFSHITNVY